MFFTRPPTSLSPLGPIEPSGRHGNDSKKKRPNKKVKHFFVRDGSELQLKPEEIRANLENVDALIDPAQYR